MICLRNYEPESSLGNWKELVPENNILITNIFFKKVNMIFAVEWTSEAVEKEPEKIQAWLGNNPDLCDDWTQRFIQWANQDN